MPTLLLVRHGRSTANSSGVLAGWSPGVDLDDEGRAQAAALAARLAGVPLARVVSSPLDRCRQTVQPLLAARPELGTADLDERVGECRYGDWTGRPLAELAKEPLWRTVQDHPSAAVFPGPEGESLAAMSRRAVEAVREWDARVAEEHGPDAVWLACTHGDIIKAVVADALGLHLDLFQRISADPASVTAVRYTPLRPFLLRLGDTGDLSSLVPRTPAPGGDAAERSDAVVGGATGA
ncbi:histidine phosphatase family protein [Streptacidiphilus sp. ASG 303]|uniref:histidine phosphatase family protein n=1 Tax=Streptomycetaceae TaxID=2062 RepID=UPI001E602324|nr:histidine phosphatase family protein [Streptacidiphilus sp. ASG 303]MCD0481346.1 MSMEG_4193 family putative phosphomutase [Streptacidiphilus sp. ASG 303]